MGLWFRSRNENQSLFPRTVKTQKIWWREKIDKFTWHGATRSLLRPNHFRWRFFADSKPRYFFFTRIFREAILSKLGDNVAIIILHKVTTRRKFSLDTVSQKLAKFANFNPQAVDISNFKWFNLNNSKLTSFKAFPKSI